MDVVTNVVNQEIHEVEVSNVNTCKVTETFKINNSIASNILDIKKYFRQYLPMLIVK